MRRASGIAAIALAAAVGMSALLGAAPAGAGQLASSQVAPRTTTASAATTQLFAALHGGSHKILGISPEGNSKGITTVPALASQLGHQVNVVNIFVGWGQTLPTASMNQIATQGSVPELSLEPWNYLDGVIQPKFADSVIASGTYDSYIRQLASAAAAWGSPFLIRYAHEMNGNWYPWAASINGNTPASYIAAWRHVHDIFAQAGASNVLWVWAPNNGGPTPVANVFPGSSYVNIIGMDGYNWGTATGGWQSASQVFSGLLHTVTTLSPGTPVLINETGSGEAGGSKATWLTQLFGYVKAQPALVGVVYSNFGTRWPLTTSSSALAGAKAGLVGF